MSVYRRKEIINLYVVEHLGYRAIAQKMNIGRKTVRKYINEYNRAKAESDEAAETYCSQEPHYKVPKRPRPRMTDELCHIIEDFVDQNLFKRNSGNRKQCMTKADIYMKYCDHKDMR